MKILEEALINLELADFMRRIPLARVASADGTFGAAERTDGVHMSGILRPLAVAAGKLKEGEKFEEEYPFLWACGIMWEEFVATLYGNMIYQPGEVIEDGIIMTCDGLNVEDVLPEWREEFGDMMIEEMKFTFAHDRTTDPAVHYANAKRKLFQQECWHYLQQGKAYGRGYGARIVRWHVNHVNNFDPWGPRYKRYTIGFTQEEIDKTWGMFLANKDTAIPEENKH